MLVKYMFVRPSCPILNKEPIYMSLRGLVPASPQKPIKNYALKKKTFVLVSYRVRLYSFIYKPGQARLLHKQLVEYQIKYVIFFKQNILKPLELPIKNLELFPPLVHLKLYIESEKVGKMVNFVDDVSS